MPTKPSAAATKTIKDIALLDDDQIKRKLEDAVSMFKLPL
jgi:hypothetical protein